MHIVLDANAVIDQGHGPNSRMNELFSKAAALGCQIYVPQVALEEIVAHFSRDLSSKIHSVRRQIGNLSQILGRSLASPVDASDQHKESKLFRNRLLARLEGAKVSVLTYPTSSHEEIVRRATDRKRPFDDSGTGYRDTLIWLNVLGLTAEVEGQIILVSKDKDFREEHDNLHKDLIDDLLSKQQPANRVLLTPSIGNLIEQHIHPRLHEGLMDNTLDMLAALGLDARTLIIEQIENAYSAAEWVPSDLGLVWNCDSIILDYVEEASLPIVSNPQQLPDDMLLFDVSSDLVGTFTVYIAESDWAQASQDSRIRAIDLHDTGSIAAISLELHCDLELVVDPRNIEQCEVRMATDAIQESPTQPVRE